MNGAESLIRTLVDNRVDVCFSNPGTSEMHFVAALDDVPEMRGVLCLFEGVATGAADGYARMAGDPAATLLHLGPGLGNGLANLHNARRGRTPMVNVVGDHALEHKPLDAPLESDIDAIAGSVSGWVHRSMAAGDVADDAVAAVTEATTPPGQVATLILPADVSWAEGAEPRGSVERATPVAPSDRAVAEVAKLLGGDEPAALLLGGASLTPAGLDAAARIGVATGAAVVHETFPARMTRGGGLPAPDRLNYLGEFAMAQLEAFAHVVLVDTVEPVAFFAYPDKPGRLVPEGTSLHTLCEPGVDSVAALEAVAERVAAGTVAPAAAGERPDRPTGELDVGTLAQAIGALLPDEAVVADESNTSGLALLSETAGCGPHDWLALTGGAIGIGLPLATGAAVACPDRSVLCVEADGSAMYTPAALWTQAREGLDVTTVVCNNGSYAVLNMELARVGAGEPGPKALAQLDIADPGLSFTKLGESMGVPSTRATTADELGDQLEAAFAEPGPHLIEAMVPSIL